MPQTNLEKAYSSRGQSVRDFFSSHEQGFLVPRYQREYTWEEENVTQLFDDLVLAARGRSGFVARGGGPIRWVVLEGTSRGGRCWIASG